MDEQNAYRVKLDVYSGPLDLLLFLIQRDEIDIYDIPIARITEQYLEYVELLRLVDPEVVSEFLVLAATLMEVKSRMLLPKPPPEEVEQDLVDPRLELVKQLLAYKQFKDAAHALEESAAERALRHERSPVLPETPADELELENLDIWDLFEAFNKLLKQIGKAGIPYKIDVDDTPVALHAEDIMDSLERAGGEQPFEAIFTGRSRGEMIGLFLAILELVRRRRVRVRQDRPFGTIFLFLLEHRPLEAENDVEETPGAQAAVPAEERSDTIHGETHPDKITDDDDTEAEDDGPTGPVLQAARTVSRDEIPVSAEPQQASACANLPHNADDNTTADEPEIHHDAQPSTR